MLLRADRQNAISVARYYHHDTVRVRGMNDDARDCIRRGLDITTASNYQQGHLQPPSSDNRLTVEPPDDYKHENKAIEIVKRDC
ncbi:hypothetical protein E4U24_002928 [Claviceps purpurea]|nr:hypothetical protein E4U28_004050 [Claviceps purpurea]KAG6247976.1 hypothetical protein E4U24_002928 [Claviceps purpurea]